LDLLKLQVMQKIAKMIQGINPGMGISQYLQEIIIAYRLDKEGYSFHPGTQQECFSVFEDMFKAEGEYVCVLNSLLF
jgi:glycine betaine/proline transport system substrate-binding protein